jgi:hypothetical protein
LRHVSLGKTACATKADTRGAPAAFKAMPHSYLGGEGGEGA